MTTDREIRQQYRDDLKNRIKDLFGTGRISIVVVIFSEFNT